MIINEKPGLRPFSRRPYTIADLHPDQRTTTSTINETPGLRPFSRRIYTLADLHPHQNTIASTINETPGLRPFSRRIYTLADLHLNKKTEESDNEVRMIKEQFEQILIKEQFEAISKLAEKVAELEKQMKQDQAKLEEHGQIIKEHEEGFVKIILEFMESTPIVIKRAEESEAEVKKLKAELEKLKADESKVLKEGEERRTPLETGDQNTRQIPSSRAEPNHSNLHEGNQRPSRRGFCCFKLF